MGYLKPSYLTQNPETLKERLMSKTPYEKILQWQNRKRHKQDTERKRKSEVYKQSLG
jgi:hypothetical protein